MKKTPLIVLLLIFSSAASAQKQAYIWYFGNKNGIDFSGYQPRPMYDGNMVISEGCASICDLRGHFLFYTDGNTIWNKEHQAMPNGANLRGHDSSTQCALAIQKPGDINTYYLFTSDAGGYANPPNNGIYYSVVDMLKEEGKGDITEKNKFLYGPAAEKLTAVQHHNGTDIWVISHAWESNQFRAFLVTKKGVETKPVVSSIGSFNTGGLSTDANSIGYMKTSPDGTRIASVQHNNSFCEVFDFDDSTGLITNLRTLWFPSKTWCYGLEFSPNSQLLYVGDYINSQIFQYDLSAGDQFAISQSVQVIGISPSRKLGALQLAPDGKIYVVKKSNSLGVIAAPDKKGMACNYLDEGFYIGKKPKLGLPNFITSYFRPAETLDTSKKN